MDLRDKMNTATALGSYTTWGGSTVRPQDHPSLSERLRCLALGAPDRNPARRWKERCRSSRRPSPERRSAKEMGPWTCPRT